MEGVGSFVFDFQNHLVRPTPPLSAIERFLWSSNDHTQKQIHTSVKNNDRIVSSYGLGEFSTSSGLIDDYAGRFSFSSLPDTSFDDGQGQQPFGWTEDIKNIVGFNSEGKLKEKSTFWMEKKMKNGSSTTLIKGQWTDQEDRLLLKLVKEHGVKKWAQIAPNMVGRAGKQCRERWHNHLRPNIKKNSWSEEEEILLIEAHQKFGNRWAEIAKQIPGRAENAIKNHWNATKRRQTAGRKNKAAYRRTQSSILHDYMRNKYIMDNSPLFAPIIPSPTIVSSTPSTNPSSQVSFLHSEPSESSYTVDSTLIPHMYTDDELHFIGGFLDNIIYEDPYLESIFMESKEDDGAFYTGHPQNSLVFGSSAVQDTYNGYNPSLEVMSNCNYLVATATKEVLPENMSNNEAADTTSQMYSDLYLSYLLEGMAPAPVPYDAAGENYYENIPSHDLPIDQPPASDDEYNVKKEMDLIEMISSTCQFNSLNNNALISSNTWY